MTTLATVDADLTRQWEVLRAWLEELPDPASPAPSRLPGWSLGDLVAHLGRALDAVRALEPMPDLTEDVLTLAEYLASYRLDPDAITEVTRRTAALIAADPLAGLDEIADGAWDRIRALGSDPDTVVRARRGPIRLDDFLTSRLIELVVHAYDLAPELPLPVPVDPRSRTAVAQALAAVARRRSGTDVIVGQETPWILAAAGRLDWSSAMAQGAARAAEASDSVADLRAYLPLI